MTRYLYSTWWIFHTEPTHLWLGLLYYNLSVLSLFKIYNLCWKIFSLSLYDLSIASFSSCRLSECFSVLVPKVMFSWVPQHFRSVMEERQEGLGDTNKNTVFYRLGPGLSRMFTGYSVLLFLCVHRLNSGAYEFIKERVLNQLCTLVTSIVFFAPSRLTLNALIFEMGSCIQETLQLVREWSHHIIKLSVHVIISSILYIVIEERNFSIWHGIKMARRIRLQIIWLTD